ncbi:MAG: Extracellular solute-binding protein family 1 [Candidatus Kaiserbacteria bacterium GW2011_GWA2_49_19]|uniref:Extracellular solute-binding protein family 1 n=1 Tax=Candidatus Kaiserbacteria bacterium GW2011_GWA2_49_19 TaxID=1618669 RepID=A0A0G1Y0R9_9BACT|nr:MAG: Extracellular solute-binding protein family 1 [Candidatus Kaiserbacteria bacterium GW2011_GWA2_49_19]
MAKRLKNNFFTRSRLLKLLTLLTLPTLLLTGFGCKGLSATQQAAAKPIALEYWTVFDDADVIRSLVAAYQAGRPYLNVTVRQLRADELYNRLVEALAEDRGPDIVAVNNRSLGAFRSKLAPMPPTVKDTIVRVEKTQLGGTNTIINSQMINLPTVSELDKEYVQTVKEDVARNGKIYGLPLSLDTLAIYYNKDLLDRSGIAEIPKTWEEFQADVKKLTKYDKAGNKILQSGAALGAGNNVPGSDDLLYALAKQSKIPFMDRNGRAVFNLLPVNASRGEETPIINVLNFYTDFANATRDTYSWNETMPSALDSFVNGTAAFFFGYNYHYTQIKARAPQLNFDVMPLLQLDPEAAANAANYSIQTVTAKSKHQNEAWALVNYLTHSGANKEYLTKANRPTALRAYIGLQKSDPALAPFVSGLLTADSWYHGKNYEAASRALSDMLREWIQPPPDPDRALEWKQQILDRAAAKVNQTL